MNVYPETTSLKSTLKLKKIKKEILFSWRISFYKTEQKPEQGTNGKDDKPIILSGSCVFKAGE